jgi:hypothetical protein
MRRTQLYTENTTQHVLDTTMHKKHNTTCVRNKYAQKHNTTCVGHNNAQQTQYNMCRT